MNHEADLHLPDRNDRHEYRGGEQVLDIFEDMEFPISECDKAVILKKEENEVDC